MDRSNFFGSKRQGATALTYGLVVGLVGIAGLAAVTRVGESVDSLFGDVSSTITSGLEEETTAPTATPISSRLSCKAILDAGDSTGNGTYEIDRDGDGAGSPETVWCDMAGGGWTYASENTPFQLSYTGGSQAVIVPAQETEFEFTLNGAQGGLGLNQNGGLGGRTVAAGTVAAGTTLYVYVGGQGASGGSADQGDCGTRTGGFNGGGLGSRGGSGGGGATDVRTNDAGALNATSLASRLAIAGGGGGCGSGSCSVTGGAGGGTTGGSGQSGATAGQSGASGYTVLGQGEGYRNCNDNGGGGGGYYGGRAGETSNRSGGGGSGYVDATWSGSTTAGVNSGNGSASYRFR